MRTIGADMKTQGGLAVLAVAAMLLSSTACSRHANGAAGRPSLATDVGYVVVRPQDVPREVELAGRVTPYEISEVRPQVSGIIQKREFTEGSVVREGQTLYQIDASLYQAALDQAKANLASARAAAKSAQITVKRYEPLAKAQLLSQQDYTTAVAAARQASAAVEQAEAQLETARVNLRFTEVPAPISGRVGRSLVTVGALVTVGQANPLAVIQRLDPVFVDVQQSSADLLTLRHSLVEKGVDPDHAQVRLKLENGSDYGQTGSVEFAEAIVDQSTGTVTLRVRFPNPDGILLPGMFVRAVFAESVDKGAYLVPEAAVSRNADGDASVLLVGPENTVMQRRVKAERTEDTYWVVTEGLDPGDKVITEGTGKVHAGQLVRPVPAGSPQSLDPGGNGTRNGPS